MFWRPCSYRHHHHVRLHEGEPTPPPPPPPPGAHHRYSYMRRNVRRLSREVNQGNPVGIKGKTGESRLLSTLGFEITDAMEAGYGAQAALRRPSSKTRKDREEDPEFRDSTAGATSSVARRQRRVPFTLAPGVTETIIQHARCP